MDRINRTIQGTDDLERTMSHALDAAFSIFGCDRAWMVYPCDPESQTWRTVIERARPWSTKFKDDDPRQGVARTRPVCPYPQVATYKGSGSVDDAANFVCASSK